MNSEGRYKYTGNLRPVGPAPPSSVAAPGPTPEDCRLLIHPSSTYGDVPEALPFTGSVSPTSLPRIWRSHFCPLNHKPHYLSCFDLFLK